MFVCFISHLQNLYHNSVDSNLFVSVLAGSKWKIKSESSQYQCQNGAVMAHDDGHTVDCLQIRSEDRGTEKGTQEVRTVESNRRPSSSKPGESRDVLHCGAGGPASSITLENLPQEEQGGKSTRGAKNSSPKTRRGSTNTPSPPAGRTEKKQRSSSKTVSPIRDTLDKSNTAAQSFHAEQITKYDTVNFRSTRHTKVKLKLTDHCLSL